MNTLNPAAAKSTICHLSSLNPHRPSLSKPLSSISFRTPPPKHNRRFYQQSLVRACSQNPNPRDPNLPSFQKPTSGSSLFSLLTPIRAALLTTVTAAAIIFARFYLPLKRSILDEEKAKLIEEHLASNPDDVDGLKNLMEVKIKSKKFPEAIKTLDRLMELEPDQVDWPMKQANLHADNGEFELAKNGLNEFLKRYPFEAEAYLGLAVVAYQEDSSKGLGDIERRVEEAIELGKKEGKGSDLRDLKMLHCAIMFFEGRHNEMTKVYPELFGQEAEEF